MASHSNSLGSDSRIGPFTLAPEGAVLCANAPHGSLRIRTGWGAGLDLRDLLATRVRELTGTTDERFPVSMYLRAGERGDTVRAVPRDHQSARVLAITAATQGSTVAAGWTGARSSDALLAAAKSGRLIESMQTHNVAAGDALALPDGILYAVGKGVRALDIGTGDAAVQVLPASGIGTDPGVNISARPDHVLRAEVASQPCFDGADLRVTRLSAGIFRAIDLAHPGKRDNHGPLVLVPTGHGVRVRANGSEYNAELFEATIIPASLVFAAAFEVAAGSEAWAIGVRTGG